VTGREYHDPFYLLLPYRELPGIYNPMFLAPAVSAFMAHGLTWLVRFSDGKRNVFDGLNVKFSRCLIVSVGDKKVPSLLLVKKSEGCSKKLLFFHQLFQFFEQLVPSA